MLYFSSKLKDSTYKPAADNLFAALDFYNIKYKFLLNTKDIWLRDFMPVKVKSGKYISFKYEPSYLNGYEDLKTNFKNDIQRELNIQNVKYSDINLDGGNIIFSPSKKKAIITDRVYLENPNLSKEALKNELEKLLEAQVIIIESLKSDMTGHADGVVRFLNENTVLVNDSSYKSGYEQRVKKQLEKIGLNTIAFPYFDSKNISAIGTYINYLELESIIFLPIYNHNFDSVAVEVLSSNTSKRIVPILLNEIAIHGGALNCISWEA